ncbi:hypothetical protein KIL84_004807 [Mauremys mutica]|uniref:Uncharacterized protein n=1 Tax=Mauremys mutica TaxID=74926 RepID=A0A9D4B7K0_9SAUR|nr:hypothetical protein KIL84_004807 [Mauremys mutica]
MHYLPSVAKLFSSVHSRLENTGSHTSRNLLEPKNKVTSAQVILSSIDGDTKIVSVTCCKTSGHKNPVKRKKKDLSRICNPMDYTGYFIPTCSHITLSAFSFCIKVNTENAPLQQKQSLENK